MWASGAKHQGFHFLNAVQIGRIRCLGEFKWFNASAAARPTHSSWSLTSAVTSDAMAFEIVQPPQRLGAGRLSYMSRSKSPSESIKIESASAAFFCFEAIQPSPACPPRADGRH